MEQIKNCTNHTELRLAFENIDSLFCGLLDKIEFCKIIQKFYSEYNDEDIIIFIRITTLFDGSNKVKYPEFLDLIFYDNQSNFFNKIISTIKEQFLKTNNNLNALMRTISGKSSKTVNHIEINEMLTYLRLFIKDLPRNIVCKLDLDQDGKISQDDLKGIIDRYIKTSFFKYENSDETLELNIHPEERLDHEKYKQIVKDIKSAMKNSNLTTVGLFKKLDSNNDGFISSPEFNKNIDSVIHIATAIKDQFYNTLDVRKLGLVDLETFLTVFKEYTTNEKVKLC